MNDFNVKTILGEKKNQATQAAMENNCPILERTGDGTVVGRCWYYLENQCLCPRHGDVSKERQYYIETGKLTDEREFKKNK